MAETVRVRGSGGVIWERDIPAPGTIARERWDEQLAHGELVLVDDDGNNVEEPASEFDAEVDPNRPPTGGAGSGRDAWVAYAALVGVEVTETMSRDDIVAAVDAPRD